jgi:hypothetical protein
MHSAWFKLLNLADERAGGRAFQDLLRVLELVCKQSYDEFAWLTIHASAGATASARNGFLVCCQLASEFTHLPILLVSKPLPVDFQRLQHLNA